MLLGTWRKKAPRGFPHGVHPPERKDATAGLPIRRAPFAPELVIPLSQHTGAPAVPVVRQGQTVARGEAIARPGSFVSVAMHAPAHGVVSRIALAPNPQGKMVESIFIRPFAASPQEMGAAEAIDVERMTPGELVEAVQDAGLVGLGGAAFPTHVKMVLPEGKRAEVVIANGCECEPYLTTDHRVMLEQTEALLAGIRIVCRAMGASRAVVATEENKEDAAAALSSAALAGGKPAVEVATLPTKYPQGAEKMLTHAVLGRDVPGGGLPIDVGAAVFNVATLAQMGALLPKGQGLVERVVTVTGPGVSRPGNYLTPLGTPMGFLLGLAGFDGEADQVIVGGPMMGAALASLEVPLTKGITGVLVRTAEEARGPARKEYPCIKCGACVDACPMQLNPSRLGLLARRREWEAMAGDFHLMDCFECGCCSYVCPSGIPLVHHFRVAKGFVREAQLRRAGRE